jgi:hypothetical protein
MIVPQAVEPGMQACPSMQLLHTSFVLYIMTLCEVHLRHGWLVVLAATDCTA